MLILQGNMWVTQSNLHTQGEKSSFQDMKFSVRGPNFQFFQDFIAFLNLFYEFYTTLNHMNIMSLYF
jgi:hypothetical protein